MKETLKKKVFGKIFTTCPICPSCGDALRYVCVPMTYDAEYLWDGKKKRYSYSDDSSPSEDGVMICPKCLENLPKELTERIKELM